MLKLLQLVQTWRDATWPVWIARKGHGTMTQRFSGKFSKRVLLDGRNLKPGEGMEKLLQPSKMLLCG